MGPGIPHVGLSEAGGRIAAKGLGAQRPPSPSSVEGRSDAEAAGHCQPLSPRPGVSGDSRPLKSLPNLLVGRGLASTHRPPAGGPSGRPSPACSGANAAQLPLPWDKGVAGEGTEKGRRPT